MRRAIYLACFSLLGVQSIHATAASVKGTGMGGACMSYPLDSGVMAYNPAGIVDLCNRVDLGLYPICNVGRTTTAGNLNPLVNRTDRNQDAWVASPEFGLIYHFHPKIAVGFLLYNEKDLRVKYNRSFPLVGDSRVGFEYTLEVLAPTLAIKPFDHFSFSVSLNFMGERFKIKGLELLANTFEPFSEYPHYVTNKGYCYSTGWGVTLGWRGDFFNDRLNFGFAWRPKIHMRHLSDYKGFIAEQGQLNVPEVFRAGISAMPYEGLTFAFDYEFIHYEQIPTLANPFSLFNPLDLLGSENGSGFGWINQNFYRFGVNYDINQCFSVRAGFRHANPTFFGNNVPPNLLTLDTTVDFVTTGFTWLFHRDLELNGFFAYGFLRKAKGDLPEPLGGGNLEVQQQTFVFALSLGWYY